MNDQPTPAVNAADLQVLDDKHGGACPVCGHEKWFVLQDDKGATGCIPLISADGNDVTGMQPVAVLSCQRCGFIRMHSLDTLTDYVESLRGEG